MMVGAEETSQLIEISQQIQYCFFWNLLSIVGGAIGTAATAVGGAAASAGQAVAGAVGTAGEAVAGAVGGGGSGGGGAGAGASAIPAATPAATPTVTPPVSTGAVGGGASGGPVAGSFKPDIQFLESPGPALGPGSSPPPVSTTPFDFEPFTAASNFTNPPPPVPLDANFSTPSGPVNVPPTPVPSGVESPGLIKRINTGIKEFKKEFTEKFEEEIELFQNIQELQKLGAGGLRASARGTPIKGEEPIDDLAPSQIPSLSQSRVVQPRDIGIPSLSSGAVPTFADQGAFQLMDFIAQLRTQGRLF